MEHPEITSLYKYRPINSFTLDIIANNRIYYPLPASFNDPFDTQCYFRKTSIVTQDIDSSNVGKYFPDEDTNEMIIATRKDASVDIEAFKKSLSEFGILSLAESQKNILMWSHSEIPSFLLIGP